MMVPHYPKEIQELKDIYGPYLKPNGFLRDDAPEDAKEALKKELDWLYMMAE